MRSPKGTNESSFKRASFGHQLTTRGGRLFLGAGLALGVFHELEVCVFYSEACSALG